MRLAIRKLTYAPEEPAPQPSAEVTKEFMMSAGNLRLEASLDKEVRVRVRVRVGSATLGVLRRTSSSARAGYFKVSLKAPSVPASGRGGSGLDEMVPSKRGAR